MIVPFSKIEKPRERTLAWLRDIMFSFENVKLTENIHTQEPRKTSKKR